MSAHTPGPWALGDENNQCCSVLLGDKHNLTCSLDRQDGNTGEFVIERDEMLANAHLIIAAPKLLEALKYARRMVRASECDVAFIDDAIAQATGAKP